MSDHLPFRLLVFDWDGTLMDSTESIVGATRDALDELGRERPTKDEIRHLIGLSPRESFERLFPDVTDEERVHLRSRIRHHWISTWRHVNRLLEGAAEAVGSLAEDGYFLAVATGKSRAGLDHDMKKTGLGERFLASRTADEAASKPHPEMLEALIDELGATPEVTLMIGDTTFDLEMANNAGCAAVGVLTGSHERSLLESCKPAAILTSVRELPDWLRRRPGRRSVERP